MAYATHVVWHDVLRLREGIADMANEVATAGATAANDDDLVALPRWLVEAERERLKGRDRPALGLALSGGGIRSATFALGVLQALAKSGRLPSVDVLSTVSGGGYVGAFLGALFMRARDIPHPGSPVPTAADHLQPDADTFPVRWLRENGRYLAPRGSRSALYVVAITLRNWLAVMTVVVFALLALASLLALANALISSTLSSSLPHVGVSWHVGPVVLRWSPLFVVPCALGVLWLIPTGVAYWLVPVERRVATVGLNVFRFVPVAIAFCGAGLFLGGLGARVGGAGMLATSMWWGAAGGYEFDEDRRARNQLGHWLTSGLAAVLASLAAAGVDSLGMTIFGASAGGVTAFAAWAGGALASLGTVVGAGQSLLAAFGGAKSGRAMPRPSLPLVALVVASVLFLGMSGGAAALVRGLATHVVKGAPTNAWAMGVVFALCAATSWIFGRFMPFLNQSSLSEFYASRLTRAYLGATNATRAKTPDRRRADEPVVGDDVPIDAYAPEHHGGPIHIVNVTLNETVDGASQIDDAERHGLPMAIGPVAVSVGVRHHAMRARADGPRRGEAEAREKPSWSSRVVSRMRRAPEFMLLEARGPATAGGKGFHVFPRGIGDQPPSWLADRLDVGEWVAVSGAAVSTAMGSRTQPSVAFLLGLLNLRLGRWWKSGVTPDERANAAKLRFAGKARHLLGEAFPVQVHLLDELRAHFVGVAGTYWNLTDGGHFENTGCYELIRRELPFIICSDAGADPDYAFGDAANMVRKARMDFGADVRFVSDADLDVMLGAESAARGRFASPETLQAQAERAGSAQASLACAAIADVTYRSGATGRLLLLKPTVVSDAPLDVRQYHRDEPEFPQQSTADQFFDEAQWESYRALGLHIASSVFAVAPPSVLPHVPPGGANGGGRRR